MSYHQQIYLDSNIITSSEALFRYLPAYPAGVFPAWVKNEVKLTKGEWIIDPYCATPFTALELALEGYRVLMVSNNPIVNFWVETLSQAPSDSVFKAALSELSKIRRGDEWLDHHLNSIYTIQCPFCNQNIPALSFLWKKGDSYPYSCLYRCNNCQNEGEKPCTQDDFDKINSIGNDKLNRARALQRVVDLNSDIKEDVLESLENYLARPLYFITTLINKIEGSVIPLDRKKLLYALILSACDYGNSLWGYPAGRNHPKQLITPPVFKENNLWLSLENSIKTWCRQVKPVELTRYPQIPGPSGGICLYQGKLKSISAFPDLIQPKAIACMFPRPNQAFWTLSALWSGWLWGREAVAPLKNTLERKRYDWNWLDNALLGSLHHLNTLLPAQTPLFSILSELDPGFISAALRATSSSGFSLKSAALNEEDEIFQIYWESGPDIHPAESSSFENSLRQATTSFLSQNVEPVSYLRLLSHALLEVCDNKSIVKIKPKNSISPIRLIQSSFDTLLTTSSTIIRFQQEHTGLEASMWGLRKPLETLSLTDHIEMDIVNNLQKKPLQTMDEIQHQVFEQFPGLLTPSKELITTCLQSYAEEASPLPGFPGKWQLHSREQPSARKKDIDIVIDILSRIGILMGYKVADHNPLLWIATDGLIDFVYYVMASSIISRYIYAPETRARNHIIVLPGSRSRLLAYKLNKDPNLARLVHENDWKFMKFRHIRALDLKQNLTIEKWLSLIQLDPPLWEEATQISIFNNPIA
jgi:hypothetical protein